MLKRLRTYLHNVLVGADQEANIITGGPPDETVSTRAQRAADSGNPIGRGLTKFLHLFQKDHGRRAQQGDINRAEKVVELEEADRDAQSK
jgi:hypothetical protein